MELHGMDTETEVFFYEQDFYVLSNFSAFRLQWEGEIFDTSEAAYHAEKFWGYGSVHASWDLIRTIREAPSAHDAFKIAERNKALRRPDWDAVKVDIMHRILRAKADEEADEAEEEAEIAARATPGERGLAAFATTFAVIFTAEWGDLTQLIAAGQAARTDSPLSVFLGSWGALTMVAGLGVLAGSWLQKRVPLWRVRLISGALLAVLAVITVVELLRGA